MLLGYDVSKFQVPSGWNWKAPIGFMIARASYGIKPDPRFVEYSVLCRANKIPFGSYAFYRQTQDWRKQYEALSTQLKLASYGPGDLFPAIDLEWNHTNGDGTVDPDKFNTEAKALCEQVRKDHGGCIIYLASYFPENMGARKSNDWKWMLEPGYHHWLADYTQSRKKTPDGGAKSPYLPNWVLHQPLPRPTQLFSKGKFDVDHDFLREGTDLSLLLKK